MKRLCVIVMVLASFLALGMTAWTAPSHYALLRAMPAEHEHFVHADVPSPQFRLAGKVVGCDGEAIPGATIQVDPGGYATVSDVEGAFAFCCLPAGVYRVTCSIPGFNTASIEVVMDRDQQVLFVLCC